MKISQQDGARLMAAAKKWAMAENVFAASLTAEARAFVAPKRVAAERAFAELVATLTEPEC